MRHRERGRKDIEKQTDRKGEIERERERERERKEKERERYRNKYMGYSNKRKYQFLGLLITNTYNFFLVLNLFYTRNKNHVVL